MKKIIFLSTILCVLFFVKPNCAYPFPIPDTGQTKCYNDTEEIPCPGPGEGFHGQDGSYLINPPSYTKLDENGNDLPDTATSWVMVRDNVTGLIWEVKTDDDSIHDKDITSKWEYACDNFIVQLNYRHLGGYSNWRVPTVYELASITDLGRYNPAVNTDFFPNTVSSSYWTSTSNVNNTNVANVISFQDGDGGQVFKTSRNVYVRAVRGEQNLLLDHFIINGDSTVTDSSTGLMWQQDVWESDTWKLGLSHCEGMMFAGYNDWRMPNVKEILSIVDYSFENPAINTEYFPNTVLATYWSSSSSANSPINASGIDFGSGVNVTNRKSYSSIYVRAVRGGQNRSSSHLVILTPTQGAKWFYGESKTIKWETQGIAGNVRISMSRQGGKSGTFENIAESTENDGVLNWIVTPPASFNCVLKIEPLNDISKGTSQGLLAIYDNSPRVLTGNATSVTSNSTVLNGIINPAGVSTMVTFEWGVDNSYGNEVDASGNPFNGGTSQSVSSNLTDLAASTIYHYRIKAVNNTATVYGNDETFRTNNAFCVSNETQLQSALNTAANNGMDDYIFVAQGTYNGNFKYVSTEDNSLTVEGGYTSGCGSRVIDPANTILDGGAVDHVLALVTSESEANFAIEGLTLRNGSASTEVDGGGLYVRTADIVTLTENIFSKNSAVGSGGGTYVYGATKVLITNNTFKENTAIILGGGVSAWGGTDQMGLAGNVFIKNSAAVGGGANVGGSGSTTLAENVFTMNTAGTAGIGGGGARVYGFDAIVTHNTFTENEAVGQGGGIILAGSKTTLSNNTFKKNTAEWRGGGALLEGENNVLLNNSFIENISPSGAGAYVETGNENTLTNNTFTGNVASDEGGGLWIAFSSNNYVGKLYNNIIWNNTAVEASDLYIDNSGEDPFFPVTVEIFNNDFDQSTSGTHIVRPFEMGAAPLDHAQKP